MHFPWVKIWLLGSNTAGFGFELSFHGELFRAVLMDPETASPVAILIALPKCITHLFSVIEGCQNSAAP